MPAAALTGSCGWFSPAMSLSNIAALSSEVSVTAF